MMQNVSIAEDTTYESHYTPELQTANLYGFDKDGVPDTVIRGKTETDEETGEKTFNTSSEITEGDNWEQSVYLSTSGKTPGQDLPDVTRVADYNVSMRHEGLATTISRDDLKNTDIYMFRVSNGELLAERTGSTLSLPEECKEQGGRHCKIYRGVGVDDLGFHYGIHMRGQRQGITKDYGFSGNNLDVDYQPVSREEAFESWQAASGMNPKFYEREADHLRPGEAVKLVAINRATGYIGEQ